MKQGHNRRRPPAARLSFALLALCWSAAGGSAAAAADEAPTPGRAQPFEAVLACRKLADATARLACFDGATREMETAEASGEIVVIGKAQAASASREAFGLHVPSLSVLTRALSPAEASRYEGVVRGVRTNPSGRSIMSLEDGAVWRQIDGFFTRPPRPGSKVSIRKGALGSFLMNVDGQAAVKVHRDE
ncbi:MAG TPA: hypothetical protein VF474_01410 [Phenylobacterium sp.]